MSASRGLDEIARELSLDGVVEGCVLYAGNRVRLTAQLILMEPERHAWAQSYDCDLSDILTTQRESALAIAACVATALNPAGAVMPAAVQAGPRGTGPKGRPAPEVIDTYWKANAELEKMSAEGIGKALQYLREITAKAPDFAPGLVGYAMCLFSLAGWGHVPGREVYPSAKQMVLHALGIDDDLGEAHTVLAVLAWILDGDLAGAEREFRRAVELMPGNPGLHLGYAIFLCCARRHSESIAETQYGLSLNPTALLPNQAAAWNYLNNGRPREAEMQARRTIESFPDSLHPHFVLGWALWCQGRAEEAVAAFEKAVGISREAFSLSFLGHVFARLGRTEEAKRLLQELDELRTRAYAPPLAFIVIYAGLGEADAAFEWCDTACRLRDDITWLLSEFPGIDPLRPDPRFADLVRRMGISPP